MLLLMFPTNLEGNKPSEVDQNGDGRMEWRCGGGNGGKLSSDHAGGVLHGGYVGRN